MQVTGISMRTGLLALPFLLTALTPSDAGAQQEHPALHRLLLAYDTTASREMLEQAGGEGVQELLAQLATDPGQQRYLRIRAASHLALFSDDLSRRLLASLARGTGYADREVRVHALHALGRICIGAGDRPCLRVLVDHLDHSDRSLREASTRGLALVKGPEVPGLLAARLAREPDPVLRRVIRGLLEKVKSLPGPRSVSP